MERNCKQKAKIWYEGIIFDEKHESVDNCSKFSVVGPFWGFFRGQVGKNFQNQSNLSDLDENCNDV